MSVRGWAQGCVQVQRGSTLVSDAPVGTTVLTVEDTTDFDDDGGIIQLNDELLYYSADGIDEDAGTIALDAATTVAAATDDRVVTMAGGKPLTDKVLYVSCGDGDAVEVQLPFVQRDYWAEGDYDDPVPVVLSNDLERVIDAPGVPPVSVALTEVKGGYLGSLQDIYDRADEAAAQAADAAANATTALTAANGKNKVTYSLSGPGATANTAGDIWFQKESATQTIIGQWEGLGGTSWSQKTLNNAVIANLDAGKLTAGSAFTNSLSVKTNFTLGDAATNGVIQSYNFSGSSVGVFIDKSGIVAKGGSVAGASITGGSITGATISGGRMDIGSSKAMSLSEGLYGDGRILFKLADTSPLAEIGPGSSSTDLTIHMYTTGKLRVLGDLDASSVTSDGNLTVSSGGIDNTGGIRTSGGITVSGGGLTVSSGGLTVSSGDLHAPDVYVDSMPTTSSAANTFMGASGRLQKSTSSRRYKNNIADAEIDTDAVLALQPRTFTLKNDESDEPRVYVGFIAEEAEDLGLTKWVERDAEGRVDQFAYAQFCVAQQAVLQQQAAEIADLKAAVAELRALVTGP